MHQVTRWIIAEKLEILEGNMTIKEIIEMCPDTSIEEVTEGIKEYLKNRGSDAIAE